MDFLKALDIEPKRLIKVGIFAVVLLAVLSLAVSLVGSGLHSTLKPVMGGYGMAVSSAPMPMFDNGYGESDAYYQKGMPELSVRNMMPYPPQAGTTGNDAEAYEVKDYSISIETNDRDLTCPMIAGLKAWEYVIFEQANESDTACSYTFKVAHEHVAEILSFLKNLDPKDISENTYTIKNAIEDFTSETDILLKKRASIDATLKDALDSYDGIATLATKAQDVESLAKIIDSKIQLIERLTNEKIAINQQLDYLARAKNQQTDRLDYSYFSVNAYENKFIDWEQVADSWTAAVQDFVRNVNKALQNATLGLIIVIVSLIPYALFAALAVIIVKYIYRYFKVFWKR